MADKSVSQNITENSDPQENRISGDDITPSQKQKPLPDRLPQSLMDRLRHDAGRRYWIREPGAEENIVDIGEEMRQKVTEVKIAFPLSHNTWTRADEYIYRGVCTLKARSPSAN